MWQASVAVVLVVLAIVVIGVRFELVGCLYLALVTPELCRVDLAEHRLPNALVLPGFAFAALGVAFGGLASLRPPLVPLFALLAVGGFFAVLAIVGGLGMGDAKLAAVLALAGGAASALVAVGTVIVAFLAAGAVSLVVVAARGGAARIAFGPYLLGGFWAALGALPMLV